MFAHGHQIGHGLAGMVVIGQAVDDGDGGPLGQVEDFLVLEDAGHDSVAHAGEDAGDILGRLAAFEADFFIAQQQPAPPRWFIATAKATCVRRLGFSKIIASVLPARIGSLRPVLRSCAFSAAGDVEQMLKFCGAAIGDGNEMGHE